MEEEKAKKKKKVIINSDDEEDDQVPIGNLVKMESSNSHSISKQEDDGIEKKKEKKHKKKHKKEKKKKKKSKSEDDDDEEEEEEEEEKKEKEKKKPKRELDEKVDKTIKKAKLEVAVKSESSKPLRTKSTTAEALALKQLEFAMKAHKWWETQPLDDGMRWKTLEHNGVMFPPEYVPHHVKLLYEGKPVDLTPAQEELATLYSEFPLDGPQLGDPSVAKTFNKNFFEDFKKVLGSKHVIKSFEKIDFTPIREHVQKIREQKKLVTKEEKEAKKQKQDIERVKYSYALVDGRLEKIGNCMIEPPGLFRGRGAHPKTGKFKARVIPEDVTINIGESEVVPECPIKGHAWGNIVHKHDVTWLASWKEPLQNNTKYVYLHAGSGFKGGSDIAKYNKARTLKGIIHTVRADYERNLESKDDEKRQIAVAMWVIDRLALRVGGEKNEDEADTVGCCSLRVEHVSFEKAGHKLTLDFLGKDSMRHFQTYNLEEQYGEIGKKIFNTFSEFCKGKSPGDQVFSALDPSKLNEHLKTIMDGLSAKVFRTYNASYTLEQELSKSSDFEGLSIPELLIKYNEANRKVAILCNHQRTVSKAYENSFVRQEENLKLLQSQLVELKTMKKALKQGDTKSIKLADDSTSTPITKKASSSSNDDDEKDAKAEKKKTSHLFAKMPTIDQVEKRIKSWEEKIERMELDMKNKEDNKTVALGTSKINYMDPRITVAWCKRHDFPIEKVFANTLRAKHVWAMDVEPEFKW